MNIVRKIVVGIAGIFVVAMALELAAPKAVHALVSTLVTVTNTPNVSVVNTPSVNVNSLPAVQIGGNVNAAVSNPTNTNGNPVPLVTQDSQFAALHSFFAQGGCSASGLTYCQSSSPLYTVPANEVAVVESVSGNCYVQTGTNLSAVAISWTDPNGVIDVVTPQVGVPLPGSFGQVSHAFSQNLRTFIPGGSSGTAISVRFGFSAVEPSGSPFFGCSIALSGYLVKQ